DGNRIVRKTTAAIYRDSEGRTRREQTLGAVGPWATAGEPSQNVFINDPVAGVSYILIPEARIARKMPRFEVKTGEGFAIAELSETERKNIEVNVRRKRSEEPVAIAVAPGEHGVMFNKKMPEPVKESLGKQMIEGVEAEGTRATFTIAAGEIGNEQPINVVHERWYSPELQVTVMTRHSDPRFGENTYRLTNINRSEPARSLFEVPSDYTIKEGRPERMRLRAKQPRENNEN
ncbi:MAG TPA: hypothetical protein VNO70_01425, partial [Blastocatellia bacterium]|nr:hypothetical protein [Blastocatellia bacterium]